MNEEYAVEFENVFKTYKFKNKNSSTVDNKQEFNALMDITFKVKKGDVVGVLGTNGSGKSTLSLILSGISTATKGNVKINGEQALIAINTGLNNQLTGLENIRLKGTLLGLSNRKIRHITKGVIEFAELGDFLYQPVKKYSSGMKARLGFSISIYLNPDILIIDEALSVGDSGFAAKCMNKINEFKGTGKTIFFISHSLGQVKSFCNKGLWLEGGVLREYGDIEEVANNYSKYINEYKKKSDAEKKLYGDEVLKSRITNKDRKEISIKLVIKRIKKKLFKIKKNKNKLVKSKK